MNAASDTWFSRRANSPFAPTARTVLLLALSALMLMGLLMTISTSIPYAVRHEYADGLNFFWSQLGYMVIAVTMGVLLYQAPLKALYRSETAVVLLGLSYAFLIATLIFGVEINGSQRWMRVFGFSFQPAEMVKVALVLVMAEYMYRRATELRYRNILVTFLRLAIWYVPIAALLLAQPDYGSVVVTAATLLVMFFVGGAPRWQFIGATAAFCALMWAGVRVADYRNERLESFLDPFDDVADSDFQLSGSLVSFARGEWTGVGYGNSVYKLGRLPEAHTDFLLAITGEELGFVGVALVIVLEFVIVAAMMRIAYKSLERKQLRLCYTVFGFAVVLFGQTVINAGVNLGLLPTKGLTMPFYSYGGSSMLFCVLMVALTLKIDSQSPLIFKEGNNRDY